MRYRYKLLICFILVFSSINPETSGFSSEQLTFVKLGQIKTGGYTHCVEVIGNTAYVADLLLGFISYDISEPESPIKLDTLDHPNYYDPDAKGGHSLIIRNDIAIVDFIHGGIKFINISDPGDLREIGSFYISGVEYYGLAVNSDYVYTVIQHRDEHDELLIIDISDISNPFEAGRYSDRHNIVISHAYDNIAYIWDVECRRLICLNITYPTNIEEIGQIEWQSLDVEIFGNLIYVGTENQGLKIYNMSNPLDPLLISQYDSGCVSDVDITGDLVIVALGNRGLKIFKASGIDLVEIGHFNNGGGTVKICVQNGIACILKATSEIEIVQILGLESEITMLTSGDDGTTMQTSGFYIYISVFTIIPLSLKILWKKKRAVNRRE